MDNEVDPRQMTDEQFAAYVKAVLAKADAQAEAHGIPAEKLQAVRDGLEDWQKKRIQSALADERAAISEAKMMESGRNLLPGARRPHAGRRTPELIPRIPDSVATGRGG